MLCAVAAAQGKPALVSGNTAAMVRCRLVIAHVFVCCACADVSYACSRPLRISIIHHPDANVMCVLCAWRRSCRKRGWRSTSTCAATAARTTARPPRRGRTSCARALLLVVACVRGGGGISAARASRCKRRASSLVLTQGAFRAAARRRAVCRHRGSSDDAGGCRARRPCSCCAALRLLRLRRRGDTIRAAARQRWHDVFSAAFAGSHASHHTTRAQRSGTTKPCRVMDGAVFSVCGKHPVALLVASLRARTSRQGHNCNGGISRRSRGRSAARHSRAPVAASVRAHAASPRGAGAAARLRAGATAAASHRSLALSPQLPRHDRHHAALCLGRNR